MTSSLISGRLVELTAQWALWGADAEDSAYRVLAVGAGDLAARDFEDIAGRYGIGSPDRLPQYTVFWVPDDEGCPCHVGLAIHEYASYLADDDRSRYDASGHEIIYSRLFCWRYTDLARHGVTFTELLAATERQRPSRAQSDPAMLVINAKHPPPARPLRSADAPPDLAEMVAMVLLTGQQVCVLGAEEVTAVERLAFVDQVLSLLPYGLRATLSAATWASATARELKLRLFFASARGDDGQGIQYVQWGQRGWGPGAEPEDQVVSQYLAWLRGAGAHAPELLAEQRAPVRFSTAELPVMVQTLPANVEMANVLRELAEGLRAQDSPAVLAALRQLRPYKAGKVSPADHEQYRGQILRSGLLGSHPGLRGREGKDSLYRTLLQVAFEFPLRYRDYCAVVDSVGGPPRGRLRSVLLELGFASYVPRLLTSRAESRFDDGELMARLYDEDTAPGGPLREFEHDLAGIRREHRADVFDFAELYLRSYGTDPKAELSRRGYLAATLAATFPDDIQAQQSRLDFALRFVHGDSLDRQQIREIFSEPDVRLTPAFRAAVARLASSSSEPELLVAGLAADARVRHADGAERAEDDDDGPPEQAREHQPRFSLFRRLAGG